ncbi:hypothetical protein [Halorhodospira halochloris]|nr:hypothetical protein [Halorhodospira halochloris]MCG5548553.1 hypothetical protein [Halorhodospira halochloris]
MRRWGMMGCWVFVALLILSGSVASAERVSGVEGIFGSLTEKLGVDTWIEYLREAANQEPQTVELKQLEVIQHGVSLRKQPDEGSEQARILGIGQNMGFVQCVGEEWVAVVSSRPSAMEDEGTKWLYMKAVYLEDMDGNPLECEGNWLGSKRLDMVRLHIGSF